MDLYVYGEGEKTSFFAHNEKVIHHMITKVNKPTGRLILTAFYKASSSNPGYLTHKLSFNNPTASQSLKVLTGSTMLSNFLALSSQPSQIGLW